MQHLIFYVDVNSTSNRVRALWKAVRAHCADCEVSDCSNGFQACCAMAAIFESWKCCNSVQSEHVNLGFIIVLEDLCLYT